jgi:hypothetical protein
MADQTTPDSFRDWATDFSSSPKTDDELARWHAALSGDANQELRQLVGEAQCMRATARILLQRLRDCGAWPLREGQIDEPLRLAAWFLEVRDPERRRPST